MEIMLEICKEFKFEASHILPKHPGKCNRLHGHSWVLKVFVKGEVNKETGFVMDYADLKVAIQPIVDDHLDHRHLGTDLMSIDKTFILSGSVNIYPSSENLIIWIGRQIDSYMKQRWSRLELDETCTSKCILTREEYDKIRRR